MTKRVAEVQQRPVALFKFVADHDFGLHLAGPGDGMDPGGHIACRHRRAVLFQPVEKSRITQQPVFHHLAITRQKIAFRQGAQHIGIGQHQHGLIKRAHQIFAMRRVDPGFATDGTVDLRQQGRGDLHKAHPAPDHGSGKSGQIADHPAAKGNHQIAAFDPFGQQPFDRPFELYPTLGALARRQDQAGRRDPGLGQPGHKSIQMRPCDVFIGDNRHMFAAHQRGQKCRRLIQQARPDVNVIAPPRQGHRHLLRQVIGQSSCSSTSGVARNTAMARAAVSSMLKLASTSTRSIARRYIGTRT